MAFRDQDQRAVFEGEDPAGDGHPIYNVAMAVGSQYAPNVWNDVLLVQFFSRKFTNIPSRLMFLLKPAQ